MQKDFVVWLFAALIVLSGMLLNIRRQTPLKTVKSTDDRQTLLLFRILIPAALVFSLIFFQLGIGNTSIETFFGGIVLVLVGLSVRWIAIFTLGDFFQLRVSVLEGHQLISDGVFRYIRHPSYTGLLLYYLGLGLMMQNWISLGILIVLPLIAVLKRIPIEENVLKRHFGKSYLEYKKRTKRILPFIY